MTRGPLWHPAAARVERLLWDHPHGDLHHRTDDFLRGNGGRNDLATHPQVCVHVAWRHLRIQRRNTSEYYTFWILIGLYCYLRDLRWIICLLLKRLGVDHLPYGGESWRLQFWTFSWRFQATLAAMHKGAFSRQPPNPANTQDHLLYIDSDFGSAWRHEQCGADRCCAMHCDSHSTQNLWELSGSYST